jgi:hypothetical protein
MGRMFFWKWAQIGMHSKDEIKKSIGFKSIHQLEMNTSSVGHKRSRSQDSGNKKQFRGLKYKGKHGANMGTTMTRKSGQDLSQFDFIAYPPTKSQNKFEYEEASILFTGVSSIGSGLSLFTANAPGTLQNFSICGSFESEIDKDFTDTKPKKIFSTNVSWLVAYKANNVPVFSFVGDLRVPTLSFDEVNQTTIGYRKGDLIQLDSFYVDTTQVVMDGTGSVLTSSQLGVHEKLKLKNLTSARKISVVKGDQLIFLVKADEPSASVSANLRLRFQFLTD